MTDNGQHLPVASAGGARRAAVRLIGEDGWVFGGTLALNVLATVAGLIGPWLLGQIINTVQQGGSVGTIDRLALLILLCAVVQLALTRYARYVGARFGEQVSARIRERFLGRVLRLPAAVVARISTGDLTARGTGDVTTVATTLRAAVPDVLVGALQSVFILAAVFVVNPLLGACGIVGLSGIAVANRWYLRRARSVYLDLGAANSELAEVLVSTAHGARTVEALSLRERRIQAAVAAIEQCRTHRMRALSLRTVLFPTIDISYFLPLVGVLLVGGALYDNGVISLGAVVTSALYLRQLSGPLEMIELWIDLLQSCAASFARLEGLTQLRGTPSTVDTQPVDDRIDVSGVHYAYTGGRDVLHGVDLDVRPGERLAIVGPSGAGKSTLGKLLAGIDHPRIGSVTVGGVAVADLPPELSRRQIVLVTQEYHVFHDSIRHNLLVAKPSADDAELRAAMAAVGAGWLAELPDGLDTELGGRGHRLDSGRAQQLALSRVVLADPHTLVLDEATAMLDPTTARDTERALSAVLAGRTVVAIAHRLHTAHDAHRVAVLADGKLTEIGTHEELLGRDGAYADLWRSWHHGSRSTRG
ncbi:MAG TPA: ABC transporter ATP-binding protein [Pseudonocardiaceae bacterium]|nr:ABC transporter ATP-binding protein [Pseudonocardiaceae bacterium]